MLLVSGFLDASKNLSQARVGIKTLDNLTTYSTSRSETTGVITIVLFHDTHPPIVLRNHFDSPLLYWFKKDTPSNRQVEVLPSTENETILAPGMQREDAWDYEGFSEANGINNKLTCILLLILLSLTLDQNVAARLIPPPLLVRSSIFQQVFEIDIVHDRHIVLEFSYPSLINMVHLTLHFSKSLLYLN